MFWSCDIKPPSRNTYITCCTTFKDLCYVLVPWLTVAHGGIYRQRNQFEGTKNQLSALRSGRTSPEEKAPSNLCLRSPVELIKRRIMSEWKGNLHSNIFGNIFQCVYPSHHFPENGRSDHTTVWKKLQFHGMSLLELPGNSTGHRKERKPGFGAGIGSVISLGQY